MALPEVHLIHEDPNYYNGYIVFEYKLVQFQGGLEKQKLWKTLLDRVFRVFNSFSLLQI